MSKKLLEKNFCVLPWTGFQLEPDGYVKQCIISKNNLGHSHKENIETILKNNPLRKQMLHGEYPTNCDGCYLQEKHRNKDFQSISSRLYYAKNLATKISPDLVEHEDNFDLKHVDLRWNNMCNQACVYCDPIYSSKWAQELGVKIPKDKPSLDRVKQYVYDRIEHLENVYLAGGEPLLMKQNKEFLDLLLEKNPNVTIRVNTNLSKTETGVFETICKFKNVHWTVSVETIKDEYEYIRYHGNWADFLANLKIISKLDHLISFNMLYFVLNHHSIFDCVKFLQGMGFHNNSFVIGPLYRPEPLNVLNLPAHLVKECKDRLQEEIDKKPGFLLQNGLENCLSYLTDTEFNANIEETKKILKNMDSRRNIDSKKVFPELYQKAFK